MMRVLCAVVVIIFGVVATAFAQWPAQASEAPWCAVIGLGRGDVYWDCQYRSLEACVPNVLAGNRGFCNPNPRYQGAKQSHRKQLRRRHETN